MPSYTLAPYWLEQFFDDDGNPLSNGTIETYAAGTSTHAITYSDSIGTQNSFPIQLDAAGRCQIYLAPTSYKFILKNSLGVQVGPTVDPITAIGVGSSGLGSIFVFGGTSSSPVTATTYASGATFDTLQNGTAVLVVDSATLSGTYVIEGTGMVSGGNTMTVAMVDLSDGAPDTPLVTMTFTSTTGQVSTSAAITFGPSGSSKNYGIKTKVDSGSGFVWGITLVRTV